MLFMQIKYSFLDIGGEPMAQILAIGTTWAEQIPLTIFFKDYILGLVKNWGDMPEW